MENSERDLGIYKDWIWGILHCVQHIIFGVSETGLLRVLERGTIGVFCYNTLNGRSHKSTQYYEITFAYSINTPLDLSHVMSCPRKNDMLTPLQPHSCSCSEVHLVRMQAA